MERWIAIWRQARNYTTFPIIQGPSHTAEWSFHAKIIFQLTNTGHPVLSWLLCFAWCQMQVSTWLPGTHMQTHGGSWVWSHTFIIAHPLLSAYFLTTYVSHKHILINNSVNGLRENTANTLEILLTITSPVPTVPVNRSPYKPKAYWLPREVHDPILLHAWLQISMFKL